MIKKNSIENTKFIQLILVHQIASLRKFFRNLSTKSTPDVANLNN